MDQHLVNPMTDYTGEKILRYKIVTLQAAEHGPRQ